jgi:Flp pilus assembly protein TadG
MNSFLRHSKLRDDTGVTVIVIAILLVLLISFGAFAIDISHLYVIRNELQNASDAGALAGARILYNAGGTEVNADANRIAKEAAMQNTSGKQPVEVNWTSGSNTGDVQRGHWSFGTGTFTPNDSLLPVSLWDVDEDTLDADLNFINAIRVITRRDTTPAVSFLAKIFGRDSFRLSSDAIGYIGFAGTILPAEVDLPIALCAESLLDGDTYSCNIGRMINSGQSDPNSETGGWTSFSQDGACTGGTNSSEVRSLICAGGNTDPIFLNGDMATSGGQIQAAFSKLSDCWEGKTGKTIPWEVSVPVIRCPGNNIGPCQEVAGAVNVNIIWITGAGADPSFDNAPQSMDNVPGKENWPTFDQQSQISDFATNGQARWDSFAEHFDLKNVDGSRAPYEQKSIYFLPDCTPHELTGMSGGYNFGILAKIPVLVK